MSPCVAIGREHGKRLAAAGQHFAPLENHLILEAAQCHALRFERMCHDGVARDRLRLVVPIAEHRCHREFMGQARDLDARLAVANDQAAALFAQMSIEVD